MTIIVVGGGIVGSTTAFYLQKTGHKVTLIDKQTGQASKAAAGIISPWLSQRRNQNWYQLARLGAAFYPTLLKDTGTVHASAYQQVGTLLYKKKHTLLDKLTDLAHTRKQIAKEIGEIAQLSVTDIQEMFPLIQHPSEALFVSGGARVDGSKLVASIQQAFCQLGGQYLEDCAEKITPLPDSKWQVQLETGPVLTSQQLVLTVGAWLPQLLTPLGYQVDVHPQKGQLAVYQLDKYQANTASWPVIMPYGEGDIIPFSNGRFLIGATHENDQGFDLTPSLKKLEPILTNLTQWLPDLPTWPIQTIQVGTRAFTSDYLPFFGPLSSHDTCYVASGLGSSGLTTGPIIAKTLADMINHQPTVVPVENYTPDPYIQQLNSSHI